MQSVLGTNGFALVPLAILFTPHRMWIYCECVCMVLRELNASHWHTPIYDAQCWREHEVNTFPIESDKRCVNFLYWSYKKERKHESEQLVCVCLRENIGRRREKSKLNGMEWSCVVQLWFEYWAHALLPFSHVHKTVEYHSKSVLVWRSCVFVCICTRCTHCLFIRCWYGSYLFSHEF